MVCGTEALEVVWVELGAAFREWGDVVDFVGEAGAVGFGAAWVGAELLEANLSPAPG